jgi:hypothetical protein
MVYEYVITLKRPNYRLIDQVSQLMYFFALIVFGFSLYQNYQSGSGAVIFIGIFGVGIIGSWILTVLKKRAAGFGYFRLGLFIAAVGFLSLQNYWMAALYALAGLLERQVKFPQEIGFSTEEVAFNSFPKKKVAWSELNNVVIKDGLITVDYKTNKIDQKEIDQEVAPQIETEFNQFCRQCLVEADAKRLEEAEG